LRTQGPRNIVADILSPAVLLVHVLLLSVSHPSTPLPPPCSPQTVLRRYDHHSLGVLQEKTVSDYARLHGVAEAGGLQAWSKLLKMCTPPGLPTHIDYRRLITLLKAQA
jgi:hypothetical protein